MSSTSTDPRRQIHRVSAILEIAKAIGSTLDLDTLLQLIMDKVTEVMEADRSTLFVVDKQTGELWSRVVQGDELHEIRLQPGKGIAGWVARTGETIRLDDAHADARFDPSWDRSSGYRTRSLLCAPLRNASQEIVAVLQVLNNRDGTFDEEDEQILAAIGGQCAVAIDNAFLYASLVENNQELHEAQARLEQINAELEILLELEQRVGAADTVSKLVRTALERVCSAMDADAASILLVDPDRALLYGRARGGEHERVTLPLVIAQTLRDRICVPGGFEGVPGDTGVDVLWVNDDLVDVERLQSVPLHIGHRPAGALQVINGRRTAAGETGLRSLSLIAVQIGRGIRILREREEEERADRLSLLGQTVGGILHDLRTPMGAIGGYAQLMIDEDDPEERVYYVDKITRALAHMEAMATEVLDFAKGKRQVLVQKVHLNRFIDEVREILVPELESFGVTLQVEDRYRGAARFDENKLKRVIFNLARNAGQAMSGSGTFTWRIDREGNGLLFVFADDGPGLPDEMKPQMFESFATAGKADGTGLGLAMAKKIVEAHQGDITFESTSGTGTTFRITLPLE